MIDLINDISQKYYDLGFKVKEIILPKEWKDDIEKGFMCADMAQLNSSDIILLFESQAKHLQIIVIPINKGIINGNVE